MEIFSGGVCLRWGPGVRKFKKKTTLILVIAVQKHIFLLVFQKCQTKTNYAFLSYMYGNYIFPHVLAHCPYSGCSSYLNSSSDTSKILSTNSLTCLYAFSPAKGGASPEAIDVASGQSTGRPSCNFKEDKI